MTSNHSVIPMHPDWVQEREALANKPHWREEILATVNGIVGSSGSGLSRVGSGPHEIQLKADHPIVAMTSYLPLNLSWVQFAVWEANTKKPGTRMVRFGPNVGVVMVLVKVPNDDATWTWYLVCRRKYQLAGGDLFFEFSRGWVKDATDEDRGQKLVERDYPGLTTLAASVRVEHMGKPIWENNAEFANKISHDLVVITLQKHISKEELQKHLVSKRAEFEYPHSNDWEKIEDVWLTVCPRLLELSDAARYLNSHLGSTSEKLTFFGENFSISSWSRFLSLWGWQFPDLVPQKGAEL